MGRKVSKEWAVVIKRSIVVDFIKDPLAHALIAKSENPAKIIITALNEYITKNHLSDELLAFGEKHLLSMLKNATNASGNRHPISDGSSIAIDEAKRNILPARYKQSPPASQANMTTINPPASPLPTPAAKTEIDFGPSEVFEAGVNNETAEPISQKSKWLARHKY